MEEKIERVARALCKFDGKDPDAHWQEGRAIINDVAFRDPRNWRFYVGAAKAAINAIDT